MKNTEITLALQKVGFLKGNNSSFVNMLVMVDLHCDTHIQEICPICENECYNYSGSVKYIKLENDHYNFLIPNITVRIESILRDVPSCAINKNPDEKHTGYLENLFSTYMSLSSLKFK